MDGEKRTDSFPSKESNLKVNSVICENGVTAEWNKELWGLVNINANNNPEISCNIDFEDNSFAGYLKRLSRTSEEIVEDDFGNFRYIGKNPNNYVQFNGELWRIIGVMKDIKNSDGSKSDKVKLIRSESIGKFSWDNTGVSGINDWTKSPLQKVLNEGAFYSKTSGTCPNGAYGKTVSCDFNSTGLTEEAKSMISEVVWNLGGSDALTPELSYQYERGSKVSSGRPTIWTGRVGLMYPSDYGYATSGGATTNRVACLEKTLHNWISASDCTNNDWLLSSSNQWTLTPSFSNSIGILSVYSGYVFDRDTTLVYEVHPSVYLKSEIKINDGNNGSSTLPFVLKVE